MKDQQATIQEFFQWMIESEHDSRYQNETRPAYLFCKKAKDNLGIKITKLNENEDQNSAPDFFLTLENGDKINLEVTILFEEFLQKHNSFFQNFERIAQPIVEQNLHLLPPGCYLFYYFPGPEKGPTRFGFELPSFRYKTKKEQIEPQLKSKIPEWFENYKSSGRDSCVLQDKKGNQVGKITIMKLAADAEAKKYLLFPQGFTRITDWQEGEFLSKVQEVVDNKEVKYANSTTPRSHEKIRWWLLISDIHGNMGTSNVNFDISKIELKSSYFSKVFLIQDIMSNFRIIEFRMS